MSKKDEKLELYRKFITDHKIELDDELFIKVTVGLGTIYI